MTAAAGPPPSSAVQRAPIPWRRESVVAGLAASALSLCVYWASLAPGLTWAHYGADGGDLLAAAVVNGVPHPPGYPLYTMILQGWLALAGWIAPASDLAWRGNLLSALFSAAAVFVTVCTAGALLEESRLRPWIAGLAGLLWGVSPLLWGQSILTEVYAMHVLIVALLGWVALVGSQRRLWLLAIPVALGTAHHLTLLLLLPAVIYVIWARERSRDALMRALLWIGVGMIGGMIFYARILVVARAAPPVNWGFATDPAGIWWLVSGAAYRSYLFAAPETSVLLRVASWLYTLAMQYTLIGIGLALWGLGWWDHQRPVLLRFSLIWIVPVSVYSIGYASADSDIYLLPVTWLIALWLAVGIERCALWMGEHWRNRHAGEITIGGIALLLLIALPVRWGNTSLRGDHTARDFVRTAAATIEPGAIVISSRDNETFALWYGTWASGEIARAAPGIVLVNEALYQFDWYARLQQTLHPDVAGAGTSADALIEANRGLRPIFVTGDVQASDAEPKLIPLVE